MLSKYLRNPIKAVGDIPMFRASDSRNLLNGLNDALQMLKSTPLFEQCHENYLEALSAVEKLDAQLCKDNDVLKEICENLPSGTDLRVENLMEKYEAMCAERNATGSWSDEIARLRSCRPQAVEPTQHEQNGFDGEEEIVVKVVKSHRDPLGGGQIKDPIKNKHCGHVYDRATMREYIESSRARRFTFYQCPYSLCRNKKNMNMNDMVDYPEFFAS